MVPVACPCVIRPFVGLESRSTSVSDPSFTESASTGTETLLVEAPGLKVRVPLVLV